MTDDARALLRAIAADPESDLPRLVYADFVEETGGEGAAEYARLIRDSVAVARLDPWHPARLGAEARRPPPESAPGPERWRDFWPLDPTERVWEWFDAGESGTSIVNSIKVRQLTTFLDEADAIFDAAPVDELWLPTAALSDYRDFARRPWLSRVRSVHFYGTSPPIEPLRALAESEYALNIRRVALHRAGGYAVPVVLSDLLESDLGKRLGRLELHAGASADLLWLEPLELLTPGHRLTDLCLVTMGVTAEALDRLSQAAFWPNLRRLTVLGDDHRVDPGEGGSLEIEAPSRLESLVLGSGIATADLLSATRLIDRAERLTHLSVDARSMRKPERQRLQALELDRRWHPASIERLVEWGLWDKLKYLDCRKVTADDQLGRLQPLLKVPRPAKLETLVVSRPGRAGQGVAVELRALLGAALVEV